MALIEIKVKLAENNFNGRILNLMYYLSVFYSLVLSLWKKRKKNKKPRILNVRLVRFWFILSLFILVALPSSLALFFQSGKLSVIGGALLIIVFVYFTVALIFTIIFAIVYFLNFLYKLAASLIEAIILTIWCFKHPLKQ